MHAERTGGRMADGVRTVGVLFGLEDSFPWALVDAITARGGGEIVGAPLRTGALRDVQPFDYALIVDRISHEVPFYRTLLKVAAARGVQIVNDPFWWSADDKFFGNVVAEAAGVATPRTMLLPHKHRPPNTEAASFRNLEAVDWDAIFAYLGFPIFMKPAYGGGWKDVYRCTTPEEFHAAYDASRDLTMMAQEAIDFDRTTIRIYTLGRERVHVMQLRSQAPAASANGTCATRRRPDSGVARQSEARARRRSRSSERPGLRYEYGGTRGARTAFRYAIDFTNPAPDADLRIGRQSEFRLDG